MAKPIKEDPKAVRQGLDVISHDLAKLAKRLITEGGVTGISLLAFYTLDVPVAITSFVLNGIILVIGFRFLEKSTMRLTLLATLLMSAPRRRIDPWDDGARL